MATRRAGVRLRARGAPAALLVAREPEVRALETWGLVPLSLYTTVHQFCTGSAAKFGGSVSEMARRPNPTVTTVLALLVADVDGARVRLGALGAPRREPHRHFD